MGVIDKMLNEIEEARKERRQETLENAKEIKPRGREMATKFYFAGLSMISLAVFIDRGFTAGLIVSGVGICGYAVCAAIMPKPSDWT